MYKKQLVYFLVIVVVTGLFWLSANIWLGQELSWTPISKWIWSLGWFILLSSLVTVFFLVVDDSKIKLWISLVILIEFLLVFRELFDYLLLVGVVVALLFFWSAIKAVAEEKSNRLRFSLKSLIRMGIFRFLTGIFVLLSFAYFLTPGVQATALSQDLPPSISRTVQVLTANYLGENLPVDDPRIQTQLSREVVNEVTGFLRPYFKFLPPLLAFGLFLVLQGLSFIFWWLVFVISWIIFLVLKYKGIIKIEKISKEAESLVF